MKPNPNTPSSSIITRNVADITGDNGNVYEAIAVISKRANQLSIKLKEELNDRLRASHFTRGFAADESVGRQHREESGAQDRAKGHGSLLGNR